MTVSQILTAKAAWRRLNPDKTPAVHNVSYRQGNARSRRRQRRQAVLDHPDPSIRIAAPRRLSNGIFGPPDPIPFTPIYGSGSKNTLGLALVTAS